MQRFENNFNWDNSSSTRTSFHELHGMRLLIRSVCQRGHSVGLFLFSLTVFHAAMSFATAFSHLRIVAAGRGRSVCLPPILDTILTLARHDDAKQLSLVYLGTATYDEDDAFQAQTHAYASLPSVDVCKLDVSERVASLPSKDEIASTIASADILMVSGGNTLYAVDRWKALGMDEMIRKRVEAPLRDSTATSSTGKSPVVLCGGSAGAIVWFAYGHSDSLDPTTFLNVDPHLTDAEKKSWKYIRVDGLSYLPNTLCVPHFDATQSNGLPRSQDSDQMLKSKDNTDMVYVGIDENAALVIDQGVARVVAGGTDAVSECCHVKVVLEKEKEMAESKLFHKIMPQSYGGIPVSELVDVDYWRRLSNEEAPP